MDDDLSGVSPELVLVDPELAQRLAARARAGAARVAAEADADAPARPCKAAGAASRPSCPGPRRRRPPPSVSRRRPRSPRRRSPHPPRASRPRSRRRRSRHPSRTTGVRASRNRRRPSPLLPRSCRRRRTVDVRPEPPDSSGTSVAGRRARDRGRARVDGRVRACPHRRRPRSSRRRRRPPQSLRRCRTRVARPATVLAGAPASSLATRPWCARARRGDGGRLPRDPRDHAARRRPAGRFVGLARRNGRSSRHAARVPSEDGSREAESRHDHQAACEGQGRAAHEGLDPGEVICLRGSKGEGGQGEGGEGEGGQERGRPRRGRPRRGRPRPRLRRRPLHRRRPRRPRSQRLQ